MALLVKQWLLLSSGIFLAHARPKGLFYFPLFGPFVLTLLSKESIKYDTYNVYICKQNETDKLLGVLGRRKFPLSRWQKIIEMKATFYDEIVMLSPLGNPLNYK